MIDLNLMAKDVKFSLGIGYLYYVSPDGVRYFKVIYKGQKLIIDTK